MYQAPGFDIEDADAHDHSRAVRIHFAHMHELPVIGGPIDDPATRGRDGRDARTGPGLWLWLVAGRRARDPDAALAGVRQVTGGMPSVAAVLGCEPPELP